MRDRVLYCHRAGHAYYRDEEIGGECPICYKKEALGFVPRARRTPERGRGFHAYARPPRIVAKIYDRILRIEAQKGADSPFPKEKFFHDFKDGMIYGLEDGSILIVSPSGKNLWKTFEYEVDERGRAVDVEK